MRIFAVVRTRNEAVNIGRFCDAYAWVDRILVADGGSTDGTGFRALAQPRTSVRDFPATVENNGITRNPEGTHVNFLLQWAEDEGADWVIFDDCDCTPNYLLRQDGRTLLEDAHERGVDFAMAVRLYLRGEAKHYPYLSKPSAGHEEWEPSLWAWRVSTRLRAEEEDPWLLTIRPEFTDTNRHNILPPLCLLHRPWPTDEALKRKIAFYNGSGKTLLHDPAGWAGPLEPLPEWARDE